MGHASAQVSEPARTDRAPIDNPVINSPFVAPTRHFKVVSGQIAGEIARDLAAWIRAFGERRLLVGCRRGGMVFTVPLPGQRLIGSRGRGVVHIRVTRGGGLTLAERLMAP